MTINKKRDRALYNVLFFFGINLCLLVITISANASILDFFRSPNRCSSLYLDQKPNPINKVELVKTAYNQRLLSIYNNYKQFGTQVVDLMFSKDFIHTSSAKLNEDVSAYNSNMNNFFTLKNAEPVEQRKRMLIDFIVTEHSSLFPDSYAKYLAQLYLDDVFILYDGLGQPYPVLKSDDVQIQREPLIKIPIKYLNDPSLFPSKGDGKIKTEQRLAVSYFFGNNILNEYESQLKILKELDPRYSFAYSKAIFLYLEANTEKLRLIDLHEVLP